MSEQQIAKCLDGIVSIQAHQLGLRPQHKTLADRILSAADTKAVLNGKASAIAKFKISDIERKSAVTTTQALNDPLAFSMRPSIDPGATQPLFLRSLLPTFASDQGQVEYPVRTVFTQGSPAVVPDNTSMGQQAYTFASVFEPMSTLGVTAAVSKQLMSDSGAFQAFMQQSLLVDLAESEQDQLINGSGSTHYVSGLIQGATTWSNESPNITNQLDVIRSAIRQIQAAKFAPNAVILHPTDWFAIETKKGGASDDTYAAGGARYAGEPNLWGVRVYVTTQVAAGTFLIGDMSRAAVLFEESGPEVEISRHHSTNFQENMISLRATQRIALIIANSTALVTASL